MKSCIFILFFPLFFFYSVILFAQDENNAYLNLSLFDGGNFNAVVDDKDVSKYTHEMEFDNLLSGRHYLKVMRETSALNKTPEIVFSDFIDLNAGCRYYAVIDEYGKFYVYKKICTTYYKKHNHEQKCNCDCEFCINCIFKNKRRYEESKQKDDCKHKIMTMRDFNDLKNTVGARSFESTKIEVIKHAVDANYLSAEQVKHLLILLDFESSKVEIARYAYANTCDKKNYFKIYDVFSFETSVSEIEEYIKEFNKDKNK